MNCMHCSGSCGLASKTTLRLLELKDIISELAKMNGRILEISGGEPLIHPEIFEIIAHAKANRLETIMYTSGVTLDSRERGDSITTDFAKELQRLHLDKIVFNLQGDTADVHEGITRTEGSFEKVMESIRLMKKMGFWVGVHFVPMKPNYDKLGKVVQLCHDLRINEIGLLQFVSQGRGETNRGALELSETQFKKFLQRSIELMHVHNNPNLRFGRPINFCQLMGEPIIRQPCNAGISKCLITPDGNVLPCPAFKQNSDYRAGNVKSDSLADIWRYSPTWRPFRKFDYTKMNEPCRNCEHLHWCQGGCKAQRILEHKNGDIYAAPDPHCFAFGSRLKVLVKQIS